MAETNTERGYRLYLSISNELENQYLPNSQLYKDFDYLFLEAVSVAVNARNFNKNSRYYKIAAFLANLFQFIRMRLINNRLIRNAYYFILTDETHLRQMLPVAKTLRDSGKDIFFITNKIRFTTIFKKEKISFQVWIVPPSFKTFRKKKELIRAFKIPELVRKLWISRLGWLFFTERRFIRLHNYAKPMGIIIGNDLLPFCRVGASTAKVMGVASFGIQHGSMNRLNPFYKKIIVDQYFLFGDKTKQELQYLGIDVDKFCVSGAPNFLDFKKDVSDDEIRKNLELDYRPIVLILLSGPGHSTNMKHHQELIQSLIGLSETFKDSFQFVMKLHPKDKISNYKNISATINVIDNNHTFFKEYSIWNLIKVSNMIISGASSAVIESLSLNVAVLTLDYFNEYSEADFIREGLTIHCITHDELIKSFEAFANGHFKERIASSKLLLNQYLHQNLDQTNSEFIANKIINYTELGVIN